MSVSALHVLIDFVVDLEKEQEKLLAQRKVPGLQSQLEEYKSALCQLQAQKHRLQTEVGHTLTSTRHMLNTLTQIRLIQFTKINKSHIK